MARPRAIKELAKRIELAYYRRPHPWRRWRRNASVATAAVAAAWLLGAALRADNRLYNSGPVSTAHAVFGARCGACHVPVAGQRFFLQTTDKACLVCHDGPAHHDNQSFTPPCVSCHVEHKGHQVLADLSDPHCTRCHRTLTVKAGERRFEVRVTDFAAGHPEFAVRRPDARDVAQVKLNHEVHLKPGLRGPKGPVQMVCGDCHRAGEPVGAWPYGQETTQPVSLAYVRGRYMNRIDYAAHCIGCHPLGFDARLQAPAPHAAPDAIRGFLRLAYIDYAAQHPEALAPGEEDTGGLRRRLQEEEAAGEVPEQWIRAQVDAAEAVLYRTRNKGCRECHVLEEGQELPRVAHPAIPQRWLAHAVFDHKAHRELRCVACHDKTPHSRETADVLLPGIEACRKCHFDAGARAGCVECHLYHDKSHERDPNGRLMTVGEWRMVNGVNGE